MSDKIPDFDLYAMLGVGRDAPARVIVAAYRTLIRRSHPDLSSDPGASERSKRLNIAREWLSDPARRRRYDSLHPGLGAASSVAARQSRTSARRQERRWERSRERGQFEVLVSRCAYLTRVDASRLVNAHGRLGRSFGAGAVEHATDLARQVGREAAVDAAVGAALAAVPAPRSSRRLAEIVRLTVLGIAIQDVAPRDAAVLLAPWREAVDGPDERARAHGAVVARARGLLRKALTGAVGLLLLGLMVIGLVVVVALVTGGVAVLPVPRLAMIGGPE